MTLPLLFHLIIISPLLQFKDNFDPSLSSKASYYIVQLTLAQLIDVSSTSLE